MYRNNISAVNRASNFMSTKSRPMRTYSTQAVLEASVAANRFNGAYIKQNKTKYIKDENDNDTTKYIVEMACNKSLVYFLLNKKLPDVKYHKEENAYLSNIQNILKVTDADKETANDIKDHFQSKLFQALGGKLDEYTDQIWKVLDTEEVTAREVGLLTSTPSAYNRDLNKEVVEDTVLERCADEYVGSKGEKIEGPVELVNVIYSSRFESYIYTGIYKDKFLVSFWNGVELGKKGETINLKARIKKLALSRFYNGAWETQLNYVKKV
jgi:hypothetical protein